MTPNAPRCECPACMTRAAHHLLETGRAPTALLLLRELVARLDEADRETAAEAALSVRPIEREVLMGPRPRQYRQRRPPPEGSQKPSKPAFRRVAAELREHIARLGADRVAELLGVRLDDLGPLLEGRVDVARSALERVWRAG